MEYTLIALIPRYIRITEVIRLAHFASFSHSFIQFDFLFTHLIKLFLVLLKIAVNFSIEIFAIFWSAIFLSFLFYLVLLLRRHMPNPSFINLILMLNYFQFFIAMSCKLLLELQIIIGLSILVCFGFIWTQALELVEFLVQIISKLVDPLV